MLRPIRFAAALFLAFQIWPARAEDPPKFADYPVKVFTGKPAKPRLDHPFLRDRSEEYRRAADEARVSAGGHYAVVILPCGSACVEPQLLDFRTGRVSVFFTVSGWREVEDDFSAVVSRADSRLIVFRGARNEQGVNGNHYYLIGEGGKLTHLHTMDTDGNFDTTPKIR